MHITVLIPLPGGPDKPYIVRGHIPEQARNKFRIKELFIIYRWEGKVVYDGKNIPEKIDEVLVSKGEVSIGPPFKHIRTGGKAVGDRCAVHRASVLSSIPPHGLPFHLAVFCSISCGL
jgi:hypothetical protein